LIFPISKDDSKKRLPQCSSLCKIFHISFGLFITFRIQQHDIELGNIIDA